MLESGDPERLRIEGADQLPSVDAERAPVALARIDSGHRPDRARAAPAAAHPRRGRRGLPAAARAVGRGRHHPGDARDGRRALRRRRRARLGGEHGQGLHEGRADRGRPAGDAERRRPRARVAARSRRGAGASRRARLPGVRQARPRRLEHRHLQGARRLRARRGDRRARSSTTPRCWSRSSAEGAREIECGVLGSRPTAPASRPACRPRSGSPASTSSTTSRRSTCPRRPPSSTYRPSCRTTSPTELRSLSARAFEAVGCEGLARVDFFLMPDGSLVVNEINTMPGLHAAVDVPADVGRHRARLRDSSSTG